MLLLMPSAQARRTCRESERGQARPWYLCRCADINHTSVLLRLPMWRAVDTAQGVHWPCSWPGHLGRSGDPPPESKACMCAYVPAGHGT